jgi:hypothetical protein
MFDPDPHLIKEGFLTKNYTPISYNRLIKKNMKKWLFIVYAVMIVNVLSAQEKEEEKKKGFQKEKLFFGGNFGLTFGDYTLVNVSPQLGYRFNPSIAAGFGVNMQYVSYKERDYNGDAYSKQSWGVAGLNVFGRVYPIQQIMLQVQPEANYVFGKQIFYQPTRQEYKIDAEIVPSLLTGGGLVLPAGRGSLIAAVFYDVLQKQNSPYGKRAIFNFGYNISL